METSLCQCRRFNSCNRYTPDDEVIEYRMDMYDSFPYRRDCSYCDYIVFLSQKPNVIRFYTYDTNPRKI